MIFKNFKLHAVPTVHDAFCNNPKCKTKPTLVEVSNGFLSIALFCPACKSVYLLELVRQLKVPKDFLLQCFDEVEIEKAKSEAVKNVRKAVEAREEIARYIRLNKKPEKLIKKTAKKKK